MSTQEELDQLKMSITEWIQEIRKEQNSMFKVMQMLSEQNTKIITAQENIYRQLTELKISVIDLKIERLGQIKKEMMKEGLKWDCSETEAVDKKKFSTRIVDLFKGHRKGESSSNANQN